jgi:hypothetical protein
MDPFAKVTTLIEMLTGKLQIIVPILAGCFFVYLALQYFSGDSHEKSEVKRYMKGTLWITVIAMVGAEGLKWIAKAL